jgi:hypothetical protein
MSVYSLLLTLRLCGNLLPFHFVSVATTQSHENFAELAFCERTAVDGALITDRKILRLSPPLPHFKQSGFKLKLTRTALLSIYYSEKNR